MSLDLEATLHRVAKQMRRQAFAIRPFDGTPDFVAKLAMDRCSYVHYPTRTRLIFTRDTGHHSSGWWKNPDYERCFHLSLSPLPPMIITRDHVAELNDDLKARWVKAFYGDHARLCWWEGPSSPLGHKNGVHHFRVFCDLAWEPIKPRGEVYSRELTEAGWKSASDVIALEKQAAREAAERVGNP